MKGQDFAGVHRPVVFRRCWAVTLAADVRKILDLYPRFRVITEQCGSFCAFSGQVDKPCCQFCVLVQGFWPHGDLRLQRFAVGFSFVCSERFRYASSPGISNCTSACLSC